MKINDYRSKNAQGTNQYQVKRSWKKSTYINLLFLPILVGGILMFRDVARVATSPAHADYVSPIPKTTPAPKTSVKSDSTVNYSMHIDQGYTDEKPERYEIEAYINEVFGDYSPQAFRLLKCENSGWKVDAVNTEGNTPEGSRDIGIFQINEYWQGVNAKFLFNWRINIQMAKVLFDENDHSFRMWACNSKI